MLRFLPLSIAAIACLGSREAGGGSEASGFHGKVQRLERATRRITSCRYKTYHGSEGMPNLRPPTRWELEAS